MHRERFGIVVDRDIDRAAERALEAGRRTATTGEVVDDQLATEVEREGIEVALHARPRSTKPSQPKNTAPSAMKQRVAIAIVKPRQCGGSIEPEDPLRPLSRGLAARGAVS
ncbi:hypothetical protein [Burkholderia gladioli]|uniref:hypothetical protein n=1 Tax=Burkholderia gladioli TaxID=28095 RepID=UPI001FC879A8|nr:hypothetical protein [Burkholderia gladioli]